MLRTLFISFVVCLAAPLFSQIDAYRVEAALRHSADWQLAHPNENQAYPVGIREWHMASLYDGLLRLSLITGDARYLSEVVRQAELTNWSPGDEVYNADDAAVGHAWLDIYSLDRNHKERLAPWKKRYDYILAHPATVGLEHASRKLVGGRVETHHDRWSWADSLYMAPPTLARLYEITGDEKYIDFIESEWRLTHSLLYDKSSQLYFRDSRFIEKRLPNGKKTFWSRGNGWVYGGLALTLEKLPKEHSLRDFLEGIFKEMSVSLKARQQADGLWYPNLDDPTDIPMKETSGTGFYVYGMAWGVNNGLLSKEEYWPSIEKGWSGLMSCIQDTGMLGYVQPVGAAPVDNIKPELTHVYATGAFLLAGTEILKTLGVDEVTETAALLDRAEEMAFGDGVPEALAVYQPYRKDDLAWENDKMAFRVYGPALKDAPEGSGIDCWMKSVPSPIIRKWYADDFAGKKSYHKDHGEGYDGYKVGSARGCGGTGLWEDGRLKTSNVWKTAAIMWTRRDELQIGLDYYYGEGDSREVLREKKVISLKLGDEFCEVSSRFSDGKWGPALVDLEVAVGLTAQGKDPQVEFSKKEGWMAVWDRFPNGDEIGTGISVDPDALQGFERIGEGKGSESIAVLKTDAEGQIHYRMGFTWIRGELSKNIDDWSKRLSK
ncbi:glycoside hydrolase family 88 protein [Pelagicoccus mobilis]|uniref:Glycoside hydrolase family 88 protein n=1 Tax=Pelagicoccus mobilis TaxID=415221 RepID=A0A934VRF7_9BACT|nr:glycoside hydrolase family 88 protein [Pelagicoccus mobilis]MBK1879352.1 glycoside hydrolase family 88 protein [Pelagicoccus mobilis]